MILVTGPTGNVGTPLVKILKAQDVPFRAAYHSAEKASKAGPGGVVLDYARPETIRPALAGIDRVFLLSPPGGTALEPRMVEEAGKAGVQHIVKLSVWDAELEGYVIAREHRAVEKTIEASGLAFTFLRPNSFMQAYFLYGATISKQSAFYLPDRNARWNLIDTADIAAVAAKALTEPGHEGKAYRLGGPEALSNSDIAEKLSRTLGRAVSYVDISDDQFRAGLAAAGFPPAMVEALVDLHHYMASGSLEGTTPWVERITGRKGTTFDDFARANASFFA